MKPTGIYRPRFVWRFWRWDWSLVNGCLCVAMHVNGPLDEPPFLYYTRLWPLRPSKPTR